MPTDEGARERTRTIHWVDPKANARDATRISGYDFLNSIREGKIPAPPLAALLGYHIVELDTGRTVFEIEPAEYHFNPFGLVHGGIASTMLDTAMTSAILTTLAVGLSCTTLEMKVNFIRPLTDRMGPVRSEGRVIHVGKRIATAEGKLVDRDNKLYAHGVTTCIVFTVRRET